MLHQNLFTKNSTRIPIKGKLPFFIPRSFMLELTSECNFNCPYCYCLWHEFPEISNKNLSVNEWKEIILFLVKKEVNTFLFTGGEVLLRDDITELIDFTRNISPESNLSLFTNASLLTVDLLTYFKRQAVSLCTSLQGLECYKEMTKTDFTAEQVLTKLKLAKHIEWPMSVSMTITQVNKFEVCNMFEVAAVHGASSIQLGAMMPQGRGKQHLDLTLSRAEWDEVKNVIRNMKDCKVPYVFCDEMICECRKHDSDILKKFHNHKKTNCRAGIDYGVISPNGTYHKCLHFFK